MGFPDGASAKEPACRCMRRQRPGLRRWVRKMPWKREWEPTPVFLPEESNGQRILAGYSPWGHKESDMTACTQCIYICMCVCLYIACHIFSIMVYHKVLNIVPYCIHNGAPLQYSSLENPMDGGAW